MLFRLTGIAACALSLSLVSFASSGCVLDEDFEVGADAGADELRSVDYQGDLGDGAPGDAQLPGLLEHGPELGNVAAADAIGDGDPQETGIYVDEGNALERGNYAPSWGQVWLYTEPYYGGQMLSVLGSDLDFVGADFNDKISSMRMGPGTCVSLYQHAFYEGGRKNLCGDVMKLANFGFDNTISSLQPYAKAGWLWLFTGTNYTGSVARWDYDVAYLPVPFDNNIRSVKVGAASSAILWDGHGAGKSLVVTGHVPDLPALKFARTSSYQLLPAPGVVWFYDKPGYAGDVLRLDVSLSHLSPFKKQPSGDWDNAIESVKVGPNTTVRLREHPNWGGWAYTISSNVAYLPYFYSNKTSSFRFQ